MRVVTEQTIWDVVRQTFYDVLRARRECMYMHVTRDGLAASAWGLRQTECCKPDRTCECIAANYSQIAV